MASWLGPIAGCASAAAGCLVAGAVGHLWLHAAASRLRRPPPSRGEGRRRFLIVIPAHNEEAGIAACLSHVRDLDYPAERVRVLVVADNCTDSTPEIARSCGAEVLLRRNHDEIGKGYAVAHALRSLDDWADALVVLDADCHAERGLLRAFDARLAAGQEAIQARYAFGAVAGRPVSYLLSVESLLENDWFYRGKENVGAPALLRGSGMCLSREALGRVPWQAFGLAEDVEYTIALLHAGIYPRYAWEASVTSEAPSTGSQIMAQRGRWTAGHGRAALANAAPLVALGALRRDWRLIDFGVGLLTTSRSTLGAAALIVGAAARWLAPPGAARAVGLIGAGAALAGLAGYGLLGVAASRPTRRQLASLWWLAPAVVLRAFAGLAGVLGGGRKRWVRTPRGETPAETRP